MPPENPPNLPVNIDPFLDFPTGESQTQTSPTIEILKQYPPSVLEYLDNINAQLQAIYKKYNVKDSLELAEYAEKHRSRQMLADMELYYQLLEAGKKCVETKRVPDSETFKEIIEHEKQKLQAFFGRDIDVPPLPEGITGVKIEAWEKQHLKLHYLPLIDMAEETKLEHWIKPDFQYITESDLPKDAMLLPGSWLLVDERPKPTYENGNQQYDNDTDFLGPVLEELRQKGLIQSFEHPGSRFYISPQELENPAVIEAIARAYNLKPEQITLPRMIEFNILGNIHHPEWGESNCSEWFSDQYKAGLERLSGGFSDVGGLAFVRSRGPVGRRFGYIGFRALGRFS